MRFFYIIKESWWNFTYRMCWREIRDELKPTETGVVMLADTLNYNTILSNIKIRKPK